MGDALTLPFTYRLRPAAYHLLPALLITKVELENVKNHAEAEFTFQPGVIAICGSNGSGKTTILEAIAWALFDHLDYKKEDFIKRGAKRGKVAVSFISDLDEREYTVTRDTGTGYSVYDPTTKTRLVEQKNQVLPWLRQHLKVETDTDLAALFKSTIGVPQGTFTYDFTLSPANRKTVFDQILKVEEYRKASDNLRDTLRHIETRIIEADKQLASAEGELKAYDEIRREHDETAARTATLEIESRTANDERELAFAVVAQFVELLRQVETQRSTIERLRVKLELKKDSLVTARESVEQAAKAAKIVADALTGYQAYQAANARLAELEQQRDARDKLRDRLSVVEHNLIETRSNLKLAEQRLAEVGDAKEQFGKLADKIEQQTAIELAIAELRERRGELQGLQNALATLDRELEKLRQRYTELSKQIETAEAQAKKAAQVDVLEGERSVLDNQITSSELAFGNFKLKRDHLASLKTEAARLAKELEKISRETVKLEKIAAIAARLSELETNQHRETERLAALKAEVARDEEMIRALESGGICPLLTERCLNLKPGESLDSRFRSGLDARRGEIEKLAKVLTAVVEEVRHARTAATEAAKLSHLQAETVRLSAEIETRQRQVAELESETAEGARLSEKEIQQLKTRRGEIEAQLREARDAQKLASQVEVLRNEQAGITAEGESKRAERDRAAKRVAEIGDLEKQFAEAESNLSQLNDPRGQASALNQIIAREAEWQREAEQARQQSVEINAQLDQLKMELRVFAALDSELSAAAQTRQQSEGDYHAYIQNKKTADTLEIRQKELTATETEIAETETLLGEVQTALAALEQKYDAEAHRRALSELDAWRERATQLATQLEHCRQQLERLNAQLARLEEVRERMRDHLAAKEKAQVLRETADFIRDTLQKAAPYITELHLHSISAEANQLFREISGRYDVTLRWAKDYEILLEEEGRERPFLNLSGGEQMAAALAVRLALLKELSEVNIAFFDEPTTNMDEERRRNLAQQIGRIKDFQQLFVISHDDSFEGFTDQIVMLGVQS
ncbi:MAG: SMC family ATPase [Acidobacteria bacterium]|nr:SMC family ATPase [Acidobacteriota bacterium]